MENRQRTIITIQNRINEARNKHTRVATVFVSTLSEVLAMLKEQETQKFFVDESGKITPIPVVVRCKDCKHGEPCKNGFGEDAIECFDSDICLEVRCRRPDWFCADGERKKGR